MLRSLISAGASLLGNVIGGKMASDSAEDAARLNTEYQKEFAQQGIRWKVADAAAAGVHPLMALGAQTIGYAPSYVGSSMGDYVSRGLSEAGQDIGRAVNAGQTNLERLQERLLESQIRGQEIENDKNASKVALTTGAAMNPPFPPMDGRFQLNPNNILYGDENDASVAAGIAAPATQSFLNRDGTITRLPSQEAAEAMEDNMLHQLTHYWRNNTKPFLKDVFYTPARKFREWSGRSW